MKYRMLKKDEWIYQSKGDEFSGFPDKWVPTMIGDKEVRITDANVGYYRRPIPEPKRRAKMIMVDGHREKVKPARMLLPNHCWVCPLFGNCMSYPTYGGVQCKSALRKAWAWGRGVKG